MLPAAPKARSLSLALSLSRSLTLALWLSSRSKSYNNAHDRYIFCLYDVCKTAWLCQEDFSGIKFIRNKLLGLCMWSACFKYTLNWYLLSRYWSLVLYVYMQMQFDMSGSTLRVRITRQVEIITLELNSWVAWLHLLYKGLMYHLARKMLDKVCTLLKVSANH